MESFALALATYLVNHPEYTIAVSSVQTFIIIGMVKFYLTPAKHSHTMLIEILKKHVDESHIAEKDVSKTKDSINEMKGLLSGLSIHNRGIK